MGRGSTRRRVVHRAVHVTGAPPRARRAPGSGASAGRDAGLAAPHRPRFALLFSPQRCAAIAVASAGKCSANPRPAHSQRRPAARPRQTGRQAVGREDVVEPPGVIERRRAPPGQRRRTARRSSSPRSFSSSSACCGVLPSKELGLEVLAPYRRTRRRARIPRRRSPDRPADRSRSRVGRCSTGAGNPSRSITTRLCDSRTESDRSVANSAHVARARHSAQTRAAPRTSPRPRTGMSAGRAPVGATAPGPSRRRRR